MGKSIIIKKQLTFILYLTTADVSGTTTAVIKYECEGERIARP